MTEEPSRSPVIHLARVRFLPFVALLFAAAEALGQPATSAPLTAIRAGRLLDPEAGRLLENQIILVGGTRIRDVGPNVAIPAGVQVIDLSR